MSTLAVLLPKAGEIMYSIAMVKISTISPSLWTLTTSMDLSKEVKEAKLIAVSLIAKVLGTVPMAPMIPI